MVISYFDHHSKQIVCVCMFPTQSKPSHYTYTTTFIFFVLVSPLVLVSPGAVRPHTPLDATIRWMSCCCVPLLVEIHHPCSGIVL